MDIEKRRALGRLGGEATRDRMTARDPNYYRRIRALRADTSNDGSHLLTRPGLGARVRSLRTLYHQRIAAGEMTIDEADRRLLTKYDVTMEPRLRRVGKLQRRRELGLDGEGDGDDPAS